MQNREFYMNQFHTLSILSFLYLKNFYQLSVIYF